MSDKMIIVPIPIKMLEPHPDNPRKDLGDLTELADSIKANGVMQNLTVVASPDPDMFRVVIGHRRMAAAKLAGLTELPCIISDMDHKEQVATMMVENMQRSDLSPVEQGMGFQMMLDLGDTLEEIAQRTGVRKRRVKTALGVTKLDKAVIAKVEERCGQISMTMLEKLDRIEDPKKRNELLGEIGTYNFDYNYQRALRRQEVEKFLPGLQKKIKKLGAKKITSSETYGGKYTEMGARITITKWEEQEDKFPQSGQKDLFYYLDPDNDSLRFYGLSQSEKKRRSKAEIEKEKAIAQAWDDVKSLCATAYETRLAFVRGLTVTKDNRELFIEGLFRRTIREVFGWVPTSRDIGNEAMGLEAGKYNDCSLALAAYEKLGKKCWPMLIYASFGDAPEKTFAKGTKSFWPQHEEDKVLIAAYEFLQSLGYVMSDVERQLVDGSHEVFHRGDKK